MVELLDGYIGSSCTMKAKDNGLISMEAPHGIGKNFINAGGSCNELPIIPYNFLVKIEVYNIQLGFGAPIGRVYLSSPKLACIIGLNEATNDEGRRCFRINTRDKAMIYNCVHEDELTDPEGESEHDSTGNSADYNGLKIQLMDTNLGGLMFRTDEIFKVNGRLDIVIPATGNSMLFACEVRRQMNRSESGYGYGCEFMGMATGQEDLLYHYILRRQGDQPQRIR